MSAVDPAILALVRAMARHDAREDHAAECRPKPRTPAPGAGDASKLDSHPRGLGIERVRE